MWREGGEVGRWGGGRSGEGGGVGWGGEGHDREHCILCQ